MSAGICAAVLLRTFTDQDTDIEANQGVGDYIRRQRWDRIDGRDELAALVPVGYPVGTRQLCVDTGYNETFLCDDVHLVDVAREPIEILSCGGERLQDAWAEGSRTLYGVMSASFPNLFSFLRLPEALRCPTACSPRACSRSTSSRR